MDFALSEKDKIDFKLRTLEFKIDQWQKRLDYETVEAKIHTGKIRGSKRHSINNKVYYSFERIPYALPPLGELRFRAPKPITAWKDVKECTWYGPKPMQCHPMDPLTIDGSEDCLYLNVYTNSVKPIKPRPVMVWFYGGGFYFGEATREWYGPDYFMKKDVILVTVQYRLGALGFLSLNDPGLHIPGNAGLKDLIMALKWIKRNAASFGGNPECVTVFGESAGASAVQFLMVSEHAKGLFQRAILQSGVATADWSLTKSSSRALDLARAAGYNGEYKEQHILNYLLNLTAEEILDAQGKCLKRNDREIFAFGPTMEPYFTNHTVLCKPVEELLDHAWSNAIPIIVGATSNEGLFYERMATKNTKEVLKLLDSCALYVPRNAAINVESPECKEKGLKLRSIHINGHSPTLRDFFEITTFAYFWHPIQKTIDARLKYARKTSTYLYRFDFHSNKLINPFRLMRSNEADDIYGGAAHTDELSYLFSSVLAKPMDRQSREYCCIERMITLWTTFAETGNPNNVNRSHDMRGVKWLPLQRQDKTFKCLNINDDLTFIDLPEMEKLNVWQSLYEMHRTLPQTTKPLNINVYENSSL